MLNLFELSVQNFAAAATISFAKSRLGRLGALGMTTKMQ
jgi:hypothetical protein